MHIFSNYLGLKKQIDNALAESEACCSELYPNYFLDHDYCSPASVAKAAAVDGKALEFSGLEELVPATSHEQSAVHEKMDKVLLMSLGSRGDMEPFLALGEGS